VDAAGIAMDGVAVAIPVVPGGVGASIAAYRAGNTAREIEKSLDAFSQAASQIDRGGLT
jgi:hypothetical protein